METECDVYYTLFKAPNGLSMTEVNRNILMTQGGVSRIVSRLVRRNLSHRGATIPPTAERLG